MDRQFVESPVQSTLKLTSRAKGDWTKKCRLWKRVPLKYQRMHKTAT